MDNPYTKLEVEVSSFSYSKDISWSENSKMGHVTLYGHNSFRDDLSSAGWVLNFTRYGDKKSVAKGRKWRGLDHTFQNSKHQIVCITIQ